MRPERKFRMKRWISSTSNMTKLTRSGTTPFIHGQRKRTLESKLYFGLIPKMSIVRREPAAKASWVAKTDRKRLGTTIPAMNRVNTTSISSTTNEEAFCLFMLFPFSIGRLFQEGILLACALTVGHIRLRKQKLSRATFRAHTGSVPV